MAWIWIDFGETSLADTWSVLQRGGLLGKLLLPQYVEYREAGLPPGGGESYPESIYAKIALQYTRQIKNEICTYRQFAREFAVYVPQGLEEYTIRYRHELLKGETPAHGFGSDAAYTYCKQSQLASRNVQRRAKKHLREADRGKQKAAVLLRGNCSVAHLSSGTIKRSHVFRVVQRSVYEEKAFIMFNEVISLELELHWESDTRNVLVALNLNTGAWFGPSSRVANEKQLFSHECRRRNWGELFGCLRKIMNDDGKVRGIIAGIGQIMKHCRGLHLRDQFRSLGVPVCIEWE